MGPADKKIIIPVSKGILDPDHYRRIGELIWVFLWLVDRTTEEIQDKEGLWGVVLAGRPIRAEEIAKTLGLHRKTVRRHVKRLFGEKYIKVERSSRGCRYFVRNPVPKKPRKCPPKKGVIVTKNDRKDHGKETPSPDTPVRSQKGSRPDTPVRSQKGSRPDTPVRSQKALTGHRCPPDRTHLSGDTNKELEYTKSTQEKAPAVRPFSDVWEDLDLYVKRCVDLGIFPDGWKCLQMLKNSKNIHPGAILKAFKNILLNEPDNPYAYMKSVIKVENGNYWAAEKIATAQGKKADLKMTSLADVFDEAKMK